MTDPYVGAIALIRRYTDEQCLWLLRRKHGKLWLLQSPRLEKESYREAIEREVSWSLNLQRGKDFIVSSVPRAHFQGLVDTDGAARFYVLEFYVVALFGGGAAAVLDRDPANEWLSTQALLMRIDEGIDLDPVQQRLLQLTEVISRNET